MTIGFIGLGRMGRPMASNLCRKGFHLVVNDINAQAVKELELLQAASAATVAEVAQRSEIIVTMLPNGAIVRDVVGGPGGIIDNAPEGALILDMSTIDPETTDALGARAKVKGLPLWTHRWAVSRAMPTGARACSWSAPSRRTSSG